MNGHVKDHSISLGVAPLPKVEMSLISLTNTCTSTRHVHVL